MKNVYKSKFENSFAQTLKQLNLPVSYEPDKISYTLQCTYTPDFKIADNVYVETKGLFDSDDRRKILAVISQHPDIDIILVFQNPNMKINKGSKTTYAKWCEKHNIKWATPNNILSMIDK